MVKKLDLLDEPDSERKNRAAQHSLFPHERGLSASRPASDYYSGISIFGIPWTGSVYTKRHAVGSQKLQILPPGSRITVLQYQ